MKVEFKIQNKFPHDGYDMWILTRGNHGEKHVAKPVDFVFKLIEEGHQMPPTMSFVDWDGKHNFLQAMFDALVDAGFKERNNGVEKELKATKYHLEDMRTLAQVHT